MRRPKISVQRGERLRGPLRAAGHFLRFRGFTIVELLVAVTLLAVILAFVLSSVSSVSGLWRRSSDKIKSFQEARLAFDMITRSLSQATLNAYLDYDNLTNASRYLRKADLKFLSAQAGMDGIPGTPGTGQAFFFQAPLGYSTNTDNASLDALLNTCGFFVAFGTNASFPTHVPSANNLSRYRLMQLLVPAEENEVYTAAGNTWFTRWLDQTRPVADNIIALIIRPQDPAGQTNDSPNDSYFYDSTRDAGLNPQPVTANQLPPVMQVTMVAIDEASARRLDQGSSEPTAIASALTGKFFDPSRFDTDLKALETELAAGRVNYRVFNSAVPIRESKWTK